MSPSSSGTDVFEYTYKNESAMVFQKDVDSPSVLY